VILTLRNRFCISFRNKLLKQLSLTWAHHRCQTCRRRKIRCDGKKPHCDTCKENRHQCLGYATISPTESKPVNTTVVKREPVDDQIGQVYGNNTKEKRSVHTSEASGSHSNNNYTRPSLEKAKLSINPKASPLNLAESDDSPSYHDEPQTPQPQNRRVPYFRYFGPTAIVPGFKQMVVSVRDNRRSAGPNSISSGRDQYFRARRYLLIEL
jgi:hypothetical protein